MKIVVTGGCGFICSHVFCELLKNNYEVIIIDNLINSKINVVERIKKITGKELTFYEGDVCNHETLTKIFNDHEILAVIHTSGVKGLDEADKEPISFYKNNVEATINLLNVMKEHNCKKLVFSSSAMVYGNSSNIQMKEDLELSPENVLGRTKTMCEKFLKDLYNSDNDWSITLLRYFNPAGAHPSGLLGENSETARTLIPRLVKVATGKQEELIIYGDDYETKDGTARRDFVHVVDLAHAHVKAIEKVLSTKEFDCFNLGTGYNHSIFDVIRTFEKVNNVKINYRVSERRHGDAPISYANPDYAFQKLGWQAEKDLGDICLDSYNYMIKEYIDKDLE